MFDEHVLVLRRGSRQHAQIGTDLIEQALVDLFKTIRSDASVEFFAVEHEKAIGGRDDSALERDRSCRVDIVARDHAHGDAGAFALLDRFANLRRKE